MVAIHDHIVVADKGDLGGFLAHTLTPTSKQLSKAEWDEMRLGMVCESAKDFGEDKADLEKLCSFNNSQCSIDQKEQIARIVSRITRVMEVAETARAEYDKAKGQ